MYHRIYQFYDVISVDILGTHATRHVERRVPRMCMCFSVKPFTLGDLSLDVLLDMCSSVKAL